jgi:hypothetical protein
MVLPVASVLMGALLGLGAREHEELKDAGEDAKDALEDARDAAKEEVGR